MAASLRAGDMAKEGLYRDRRQVRIAERLSRLVGPGAATFFRDACRHLADPSAFESTSHQVGHLIREIESAIRDVLKTVAPSVPRDTKSAHKKTIRLVLGALGIPEKSPVAKAWLKCAKGTGGLDRRAHRDSLEVPRPVDDEFRAFWEGMQGVFDEILENFEKHFLGVYRTIDALMDKDAPTSADVTFLRKSIPNNLVARQYLFSQLTKPEWFRPMVAEGFFAEVPPAERDEAAQTISFPRWPAGKYLVEMAKVRDLQRLVLEVSLK